MFHCTAEKFCILISMPEAFQLMVYNNLLLARSGHLVGMVDSEIVTCQRTTESQNFNTKWPIPGSIYNQPREETVFSSLSPPGEWLPGFSITSIFYHPNGNKRTHKLLLLWLMWVSPPKRKCSCINRHRFLEKSTPEMGLLENGGHKCIKKLGKKKRKIKRLQRQQK